MDNVYQEWYCRNHTDLPYFSDGFWYFQDKYKLPLIAWWAADYYGEGIDPVGAECRLATMLEF